MTVVVGIRFKDSGKIYFFSPNNIEPLAQGDPVIVETVRGPELAKVAHPPRDVDESEIVGELKPVIRRAELIDFERMRSLNERQDELVARCDEKIQEHALPMRLVKAEYSFDGSRLTFYFTAEKRVDFRLLVRDLARTFRTRIELRQIGPRDEAKLLGGIGPCGRLLCCATFLPDYARVSIKMAKDQDLPLNPSKISGVCGRLLCCLSYEHDQYLQIKEELPRKGAWVQTPDGPGEVVTINVVRETVMVQLADSGVQEEYDPAQLQEATRQVGDLARSRNEEGITPAVKNGLLDRSRNRDQKHAGERRMLRDEIDNPEILEALAMLEEGFDDDIPPSPPRPQPRSDERKSAPRAEQQRQHSKPDLNRSQRPQQSSAPRSQGEPSQRTEQRPKPANSGAPQANDSQSSAHSKDEKHTRRRPKPGRMGRSAPPTQARAAEQGASPQRNTDGESRRPEQRADDRASAQRRRRRRGKGRGDGGDQAE
jgi:cell fate regulator YaaT (PSP1 superfamily)